MTGPEERLLVSSAAVFSVGNECEWEGRPATLLSDQGRIDPAGQIEIQGRVERFLKIGARRVDPREIEQVLERMEGVEACFVDVVVSPGGSERLAALVAGAVDRTALRRFAQNHLTPWKVPKRIRVVGSLPVTGRGKPDRSAMRALLRDEE